MEKKKAGVSLQDRESVAAQPSPSLPGPNGNGAGTKHLPRIVREPKLDEPEADRGNTAQEDKGLEVKDTPALPSVGWKRRLLFAVIGIVLLAGVVIGVRYWLHSRLYESTDDAFIEGHATQVSPKVSGYVQRIYITDNQQVKAGDLLVEIDPRDYEVKLAQARAALSAATARSKAAQAGDRGGDAGGLRRAGAGDADDCDVVDETTGVLDDARYAVVIASWGRQADKIEAGGARRPGQLCIFLGGQVDDDDPIDSGGDRVMCKGLGAVTVDRVVVTHQHDRDGVVHAAQFAD